jgi:hypothetical protein
MSLRTIKEFEDIMQPIIGSLLGWSSEDIRKNVRIGWQLDGPPAFKITDNVVFITATPVDDPYNRQHDVLIEAGSPDLAIATGMTRVTALNVIAYGPDAMSNLQAVKIGMFYPATRNTLTLEEIYLISDVVEAKRVPESFQGRWWERGDMQLRFNELLIDTQQQNEIDSVEVSIDEEDRAATEFTVPNN